MTVPSQPVRAGESGSLPWHVSDRLVDGGPGYCPADLSDPVDPLPRGRVGRLLSNGGVGLRFGRVVRGLKSRGGRIWEDVRKGLLRRRALLRSGSRALAPLPGDESTLVKASLADRARFVWSAVRLNVALGDELLVPVMFVSQVNSTVPPVFSGVCREAAGGQAVELGAVEQVTETPPSFRAADRPDGPWLAGLDVRRRNPIGFAQAGRTRDLLVQEYGSPVAVGRKRRALLRAAPRARSVSVDSLSHGDEAAARLIVDLAGVGAPVVAQGLSDGVARLLGPQLSTAVLAMGKGQMGSAYWRERHSVEVRSAALRHHSAFANAASLAGDAGLAEPSCSVLLATNRKAMVGFALDQISRQRYENIEVLCGLHGFELSDAEMAQFRLLVPAVRFVGCSSEQNLGQVLADLGSQACGDLVVKWDDDDWYDTDHLGDLVSAMRYSGADMVGKAAEFVYLSGLDLTIRRFATGSESFSTTLAGGTLMTTRRLLAQVGGWPGGERRVDRLLIEAFQDRRLSVYRMHGFGYVLRRQADPLQHTWTIEEEYFVKQAVDQRPGLDLDFAGVAQ